MRRPSAHLENKLSSYFHGLLSTSLLVFLLNCPILVSAETIIEGVETLPGTYDQTYTGIATIPGLYDFTIQARYTTGLQYSFGKGMPAGNDIITSGFMVNTTDTIASGPTLADIGIINSTASYFTYRYLVQDANTDLFVKVSGSLYSNLPEPPYFGTVYSARVQNAQSSSIGDSFAVPEISASGAMVALMAIFALMIFLWEILTARHKNSPKDLASWQ
jgi:hypothetical protein